MIFLPCEARFGWRSPAFVRMQASRSLASARNSGGQIAGMRAELGAQIDGRIIGLRDEFSPQFAGLRQDIEETRRHMRVLHEDVISRLATIQAGQNAKRPQPRRKPK